MTATSPTIAMTISVVCVVSLRVGQMTLRTSVVRLADEIPGSSALLRLHRDEHRHRAQHQQPDDPQQQRLVGPVVEPGDAATKNDECSNPLGQIGDCAGCVYARSHRLPGGHVTRSRSSRRCPMPTRDSDSRNSACIAAFGRPGGNRTPNLRFWRPPLCQLSYWP